MTLASQVTQAIATYCGIRLTSGPVTQKFDGDVEELIVKIGPATAVTSITDNDNSTTVAASTYSLDTDLGSIYLRKGGKWGTSKSRQRYTVVYTAGYTTIPDDIQLAIDTWVNYLTTNNSGSLQSYKTGDDSETYYQIGSMPDTVKGLLQKYRRVIYWH